MNGGGAGTLRAKAPPLGPGSLSTNDLIRAWPELRATEGDGMATLYGHFAVWNSWTRIDSKHEGKFMERVAPGSMQASFQARTPKVLINHGRDPVVGDKVLGIPTRLEEDNVGAAYEVPLLDTTYNRDLEPGIRAGGYGASFRFTVEAEDVVRSPNASAYNPDRLPERTIREANVAELSVVTFPAYTDATAGVRSLTDWYRSGEPGVRAVVWTPARRRERLLLT